MKACILCLQTNTNICKLGDSAAVHFIQEIFVNNGFQVLNRNNYICIICNYLLKKSYKFIQKTLRAQKVLKELLEQSTKITVTTLRQIDRDKLDLDFNLTHQDTEINYHLYDGFEEFQTKLENFENELKINENCYIKTEQNACGSETIITPENDFSNGDYSDGNYDEDLKDIAKESVYVKEEGTNEIEIKIDFESSFTEVPIITRRERKPVNYKETSDDFKIKSKRKKQIGKGRHIKCESKDKSDVNGNSKAVKPKRQRKKKVVERKRKLNIVDSRKYPMKCDHCKYVVQNKTEHFHHYLMYHREIPYPYGREAKYVCQHCGVAKTTAHVLHQHELTHGEKKVPCTECGKLFHNETRLKRHLRRHGAAARLCDYCGKGFVAREDLVLHIRTHTGVKPFKCSLCDAAFAHKGNVAIHMRSRHQQHADSRQDSRHDSSAAPI